MRDYDSPLTGNDNFKTPLYPTQAQEKMKALDEITSRQEELNQEYRKLIQELENKLDNLCGFQAEGNTTEPKEVDGQPHFTGRINKGLFTYAALNTKLHKQIERLRELL